MQKYILKENLVFNKYSNKHILIDIHTNKNIFQRFSFIYKLIHIKNILLIRNIKKSSMLKYIVFIYIYECEKIILCSIEFIKNKSYHKDFPEAVGKISC